VIDAGILGEPLVEPDLTGSHQLAEEPEHQASFRNSLSLSARPGSPSAAAMAGLC